MPRSSLLGTREDETGVVARARSVVERPEKDWREGGAAGESSGGGGMENERGWR